jgi:uncharacterized protein (TIGR02145 family)
MKIKKTGLIIMALMLVLLGIACKAAVDEGDPIGIVDGAPLIDGEGNRYRTVVIGGRTWMAENFKGTITRDNQAVVGVHTYDNNAANSHQYGRLYTWPAALAAAPAGWHLPSNMEWDALISLFGGRGEAGGALKEVGTTRWHAPNTGASNSSGFSAVASGFRGPDGLFYALGEHGSYWGVSTGNQPLCVYLYHNAASVVVEGNPGDRESGIAFAVRYVKD